MCERERVRERRESEPLRRPEAAEKEEGWTTIKRRQKTFSNITSFFVYNLPSSITNLQLKSLFQHHRNLVDTFIPKKKDKFNNPFGFIRFRNIFNPQAFLPTLQNIKLDGLVLSIHLAKNDKSGKPIPHPQKSFYQNPKRNQNPSHSYHGPPPPFNHHHPSNLPSFKEKLLNNPSFAIPDVDLSKSSPKSPIEWKDSSILAKVKTFETLSNTNLLLNDPDYPDNISISYVGGLHLLLKFDNPTNAKDFLEKKEKFLSKWFSSFAIWNGQDVKPGKILNANIFGIPLQFWDCEFINEVASTAGIIMAGTKVSHSCKNLSLASVTLLVDSCKRLDNIIQVSHGNKSFHVRIVEDGTVWSPTFFSEQVDETSDDEKSSDDLSDSDSSDHSPLDEPMHDNPSPIGNDKASVSPHAPSPHDLILKDAPYPENISCPINISPHVRIISRPHQSNPNPPLSPKPSHANPKPPPPYHQNSENPILPPKPTLTIPATNDPLPTPSRKRQRCRSPENLSPLQLDLNSPPPSLKTSRILEIPDYCTAPALLQKYSSFSSRITPPTIPFDTLLNQEIPLAYPNQLAPSANLLPPPPCIPSPPPSLSKEVEDTIAIGDCIGINLEGFEELVAESVNQSRVTNVPQ